MMIPPQRQFLYIITIFIFAFAFLSNWQFYNSIKIDYYWQQQQQQQQSAPLQHQGDDGATRLLDVKDDELRSLFQDVCNKVDVQRKRYLDDDDDCILQKVLLDPKEDINDCTPFEGGSNNLFGLKWCAWTPKEDGLSSNVLQSIVPSMEKAPIEAFQSSFLNKPRGIVIDAGAQIGLFSAAALAAGHYTISIDARPEHAQMNMVSRRLNNMTSVECGFVVSGALADRCGNRWATIPREVQKQNPGGTNIVGRVSDGYPFFATRDQFTQLYAVPILTLDYIVDKALQHLPDNVERKVYALKIDIEGYEPLALLGALRMLSKLRPDVIVMELFMGRSIDCSLHQLIKSLAKMGYSIDALDRIPWHKRKRLDCDGKNTCTNLTWGSTGLDNFLTRLHGRAEMDLIMSKVNNNNNRSIVA